MVDFRRRQVLRAGMGGASAVTVLAGCLGGQVASQAATVEIRDGGFDTCNVKITKEGNVVWENPTEKAYVVSSASDNWDFEVEIASGEATQRQFRQSGVFVAAVSEPDKSPTANMKIAVGSASIEDEIESC